MKKSASKQNTNKVVGAFAQSKKTTEGNCNAYPQTERIISRCTRLDPLPFCPLPQGAMPSAANKRKGRARENRKPLIKRQKTRYKGFQSKVRKEGKKKEAGLAGLLAGSFCFLLSFFMSLLVFEVFQALVLRSPGLAVQDRRGQFLRLVGSLYKQEPCQQ